MFHDTKANLPDLKSLTEAGTGAIAYMREMTAEEIASKFDDIPELQPGITYWAMFAADGTPLMLAGTKDELANSAYFNDLEAILPN